LSGTTQVSRYQKGKTNLDFTEQETVSGSDISWAVCKSAPRSRQITTPAPHHSVFTGRMPFLPPNQQRQSNEGENCNCLQLKYMITCRCTCKHIAHCKNHQALLEISAAVIISSAQHYNN